MNYWYEKYQNLNLKNGKIEFILEDDEDMIEIRYDDGMLIDIGYINEDKKYYITVVESDDSKNLEKPLAVIEVISKESLFSEIQIAILNFRK